MVSVVIAAACGLGELLSRSEDVCGLVVVLGWSEDVASTLVVIPIWVARYEDYYHNVKL